MKFNPGADTEEQFAREEYDAADDNTEKAPPVKPIVFTRAGVKKWLVSFERRLDEMVFYQPRGQRLSLRDVVRAQVYQMADCIRDGGAYKPFTYSE